MLIREEQPQRKPPSALAAARSGRATKHCVRIADVRIAGEQIFFVIVRGTNMRARQEDLPELEDVDFPLDSTNSKRSEAEAFVRLHGYTVEDACALVELSLEEYHAATISPQSRIKYLPTPDMIKELCAEIRANRPIEDDPEWDLRYDDTTDLS